MRIAIDVRNLLKPNYSGVSEYTYQVIRHLLEIDRKNEYILFYNSYKKLGRFLPKFDYPNVTVKQTNYPNKLFNLSLLTLNQPKLDKLIGGADIFFCPDTNFSAFSDQTKNIMTVHDLSSVRYPEFFNRKHALWQKLILAEKKIAATSHLFAVSQSTKRDLIELFGIPENKITVTHLGLDPLLKPIGRNSQIASDVRKKYNLPEKYLLFLATLEPRKNVPSIIKAMEYLNQDIPLVIAGKKGWKYNEIFQAAKESTRKIIFLDYVGRDDKPALYSLAEALVWPSFYEGFGLPPLEAQACGTPVIVGANSSLTEIIGNSGLLVNSDNIQEIGFAMNQILSDNELRETLIKRGFENVKRFSWQKTAEETLRLFSSL